MVDPKLNMKITARDEASKKLNAVGRSAMGMGSMLKKAAMLGATYFGVRAIKNFAAESIAAFGVQETAVRHLQDALNNLGVGDTAKEMRNFAAEIQKVTTIGDETTIQLMALGSSMGKMSGETLKAATQAAIGFSKSLGMDTKAAMTLVAKAAQGNTDTFTRYGIQLDSNMTAQEKFQEILRMGADAFQLARGETETYTGKMQMLGNTWGDFKETVCEALANYLPGLTDSFKILQVVIENWGLSMDIVWKSIKLGLLDFWEDTKHFFGVAIPELLHWFARNWKEIFTDLWNMYKTFINNMWENWKNFFSGLWSWIKGEGFDFQWTGLLDGFESTLKEMPKITKRVMTDTEKTLAAEIDKLKDQFGEKLAAKLNVQYDAQAVAAAGAAAATIGGKPEKAMAKKGAGGGQAQTMESRFLTMTSGRDQVEKNTGDLVKINNRQVKLTETLVKVLEKNLARGIGPTMNDIQVTSFT